MSSKRKCSYCGKFFDKDAMIITPILAFCSPEHQYEYGMTQTKQLRQKVQKHDKKRFAKKKRSYYENDIKTRKREAQAAFNAYIRERDRGLPCISCDKPDDGSHQRHASHYKSVGANSALRFNELDVHASCSQCNNMKSGNIQGYRPRLIEKIGQDKFDWLETQNQTIKYTCDELKEIELKYKNKLKELKAKNIPS